MNEERSITITVKDGEYDVKSDFPFAELVMWLEHVKIDLLTGKSVD